MALSCPQTKRIYLQKRPTRSPRTWSPAYRPNTPSSLLQCPPITVVLFSSPCSLVPSVVGSGSLSFYCVPKTDAEQLTVLSAVAEHKQDDNYYVWGLIRDYIWLDIAGICWCCVSPPPPPLLPNPVWFGVFCLGVKRDNYPHRISRSQRRSLTVERSCVAPHYTSLNYRLHQSKWENLKEGLFYYTSVSILTFWKIFFLFGELQHILFAEVSLQWKKRQKKNNKKQHILNNYHEGIIDRMLSSIAVLSFFHFTVITVVKKREKKN